MITAPETTGPATPPMGWNSWTTFGCDSHEDGIRQIADALVDTGLRDAGYTHVIVDDGWYHPQRTVDGTLRADPDRFPSGMPALADHLRDRGLKLGLYQTPTDRTCAQRAGVYPGSTGSRGHERQDAETFAEWGVDYLKYDWCSPEGSATDQLAAFTTMRDALAATGRPIGYGINPNSCHAEKTGATVDFSGVANSWRTTENIAPTWRTGQPNTQPMGVLDILDITAGLAHRAGTGRFTDPDMLQIGVPAIEEYPALTPAEARAHLGMWALLPAPLILAADPRTLATEELALLTNPRLTALNQNRLARPARRGQTGPDAEIWVRHLDDGDRVVGLLNRADHAQQISYPLVRPAKVTDVWSGEQDTVGTVLDREMPAHALALFRVTSDRN